MSTDVQSVKLNPFYLRKMHTYVKCLDLEGTNTVTRGNIEALADRYQQLSNLNTLRERQARRKIRMLWKALFEEVSTKQDLTPEVFGQCIAVNSKEQIISYATHYSDVLFDLIDLNGDGVISLRELTLLHKLFLQNETTAAAAFKALDTNKDGVIEYAEFTKAVINFFMPDIEKETPDSVVFGPLAK